MSVKKGDRAVSFFVAAKRLIPLAAERHQQLQQADEQVVDAQEQPQRRHHVVGFASVHDAADVIQDIGGENQHANRGNGQAQRGELEKQIRQRRDDQQEQTYRQETNL